MSVTQGLVSLRMRISVGWYFRCCKFELHSNFGLDSAKVYGVADKVHKDKDAMNVGREGRQQRHSLARRSKLGVRDTCECPEAVGESRV